MTPKNRCGTGTATHGAAAAFLGLAIDRDDAPEETANSSGNAPGVGALGVETMGTAKATSGLCPQCSREPAAGARGTG
jgi:hypothetical protein